MKSNHYMKCTPLDQNVARIKMVVRRERKARVPHTAKRGSTHLLSALAICLLFGVILL